MTLSECWRLLNLSDLELASHIEGLPIREISAKNPGYFEYSHYNQHEQVQEFLRELGVTLEESWNHDYGSHTGRYEKDEYRMIHSWSSSYQDALPIIRWALKLEHFKLSGKKRPIDRLKMRVECHKCDTKRTIYRQAVDGYFETPHHLLCAKCQQQCYMTWFSNYIYLGDEYDAIPYLENEDF